MGAASVLQPREPVGLPGWLPKQVRVYLAHTEGGTSIRALARAAGCHPSTTLRQVHRTETLRDDPLVDAALTRLGRFWRSSAGANQTLPTAQDPQPMKPETIDNVTLARETLRVLKALMAPHTLLVVADGVEDAVVVQNAGGDRPVRRAVLSRELAETLLLRGFIAGQTSGRLSRYTITAAGRAEASQLLAQAESARAAALGDAEDAQVIEAQEMFAPPARRRHRPTAKRSAGTEPPLQILARRRRSDGSAWLPPELLAAALRFQESYEIARMGGRITRDWESLVAGRVTCAASAAAPAGHPTRRLEAEQSLEAAIRALGPDLAETVILGVCQEEGMEEIEGRLDYPARSGKIVPRIALRSLARHCEKTGSEGYDLIY